MTNENEIKVCVSYGGSTCFWLHYGCEIVERTESRIEDVKDGDNSPNIIRKEGYNY